MATTGTQPQQHGALVEEKFFNIRLGESGGLIKEALEEAAGMELTELAPGMWTGTRQLPRGLSLEITARAQAVEDGTTVELRVEHRRSPGATALLIFLIMIGAMVLLPLIPIIMYTHKAQQLQQRERLVLMHKMWSELSEIVGAPKRATYREAPKRIYVPESRRQAEAAEQAALAEAEAEAAEAAEAAAQARRT
jgi:hypothetical protein